MERLNLHIAEELGKHCSVYVVAPKGAKLFSPQGAKVAEVPLKPLPLFFLMSALRVLKIALTWKPDAFLAGSGLCAPLAKLGAILSRARSIVYVHGLDLAVPSHIYQTFWLPTIRSVDQIIANSQPTAQLAIDAGASSIKIEVVNPGVSRAQVPLVESRAALRKRYNIESRRIILSVGRLTRRKGVKEFVDQVLPNLVKMFPDIVYLVIGDSPSGALYGDSLTKQDILEIAERRGIRAWVSCIGSVDEEELACAYAEAELHMFPVLALPGDPEGFGMVALEAASYGVPTVAYACGGVVDAIEQDVSGLLCEPGNAEDYLAAVVSLFNAPMDRAAIVAWAQTRSWDRFGEQLIESIK